MKTQIIILVLLLHFTSCKSQIIKKDELTIKKDTTMEHFDINKYKKLPVNPKTGLQVLPNGDEVQHFTGSKGVGFVERTKIKNSPYCIVKVFYQNTSLQAKGNEFYGLPIGIHNEYDEKGNLIKETNYDKDYKFSIDDLIKKMKEKYNYDLMNVEKTYNLNRYIDSQYTKLPIYELYYRDNKNHQVLHSYIINGNTGEVLFTTLRNTQGKQGSLFDKFIESLKQKKEDKVKIFTTYKGKNYTEEEWRKYEEELYQKDKKRKK
jgi:hypothetical protein